MPVGNSALTANPAYAEEEEKYKVWPTNDDRDAFKAVMDAGSAQDLDTCHDKMAEAYRYFLSRVGEWLGGDEQPKRSSALAQALKDHVRLIILDLDDADEPQAIFETLNAHGTPLLPADLIKNWLLWQTARKEPDGLRLYSTYWRPFDKEADY